MTFTEIFEYVYSDSEEVKKRIEKLPKIDRIVWKIYQELDGRAGFDHWFGNIDNDIKDEIFDSLKEIMDAEEDAIN
jgi:hypothetical protein